MANTKLMGTAFLFIAMIMFSSWAPAVSAGNCMQDCVDRCSNGKNLDSCQTMCKTACVPAEAAKEAAFKVKDAIGL